MTRTLIAAAVFALFAGCATTEPVVQSSTPAAEPAKPELSAEASAALKAAQDDAKLAKSKNALWTTAEAALKAAEDAAAKGDSATVLAQSKKVSTDVKRGLAQLDYPPLKVGD